MSRKDLGTNLAVALTDASACGKNQPFTLVGAGPEVEGRSTAQGTKSSGLGRANKGLEATGPAAHPANIPL